MRRQFSRNRDSEMTWSGVPLVIGQLAKASPFDHQLAVIAARQAGVDAFSMLRARGFSG
jgi:hypothetical protein